MKLGRLGESWLVSTDGQNAVDVTDLIDAASPFGTTWTAVRESLVAALADRPPIEVEARHLGVPFAAPSQIVGLLGNDVDRHTDAGGRGAADGEQLGYFLKAPSSLVGPAGSVRLPSVNADGVTMDAPRVVPECELAVVIGRGGSDLAVGDIGDHIAGYTIALDLTLRGPGERSRRKSYDTFCPVGPWLVTPDEVGDPDNLTVRLWVGDEPVQDWNTAKMVSSAAETVAYVSRSVPLETGDVILTGAPKMTRVLAPGDTLRGEIERVGTLEIAVIA